MKLNNNQLQEIDNIFSIAEKFTSKISRKPIFDIGYIKIKNKVLLGYHLECYPVNNKIPKHVDIQFWIGEVKDFKKETIDLFLEDFEYTEKNGLEIEKLKKEDILKYKNILIDIVSKN